MMNFMLISEFKNGRSDVKPLFITVDAETEVISEGVEVISKTRDSIEIISGVRLPITWFVRLQRSWPDSVNNDDPAFFELPLKDYFDGFALAKKQLLALCQRGDEVAWHYHASNYVYRNDLSHDLRMEILKADLRACFRTITEMHPEFEVIGFRFGWFFVPDYEVYETLYEIGVRYDASVDPIRDGKNVAVFKSTYPPSITREIHRMGNMIVFPRIHTYHTHDWTVVPHEFNWHSFSPEEAEQHRFRLEGRLRRMAADCNADVSCVVYKDYLKQRPISRSPFE